MLLRSLLPHSYQGTRPGTTRPWAPGETREVPAETATYLLGDFPGLFEEVAEPVAVVIAEPPADRAMKSPARRRKAR